MKTKVFRRTLSLMLCFFVFGFTFLSVPAFASSGQIVEVKPGSSAPVSSLTNDQRDFLVDQALNNYFPKLSGYAYACARATLSAALKLYEEKNNGTITDLQYYLKSVALSARFLTAASSSSNYLWWRSNGEVLMSVSESLAKNNPEGSSFDWDSFTTDTCLTAVERFIDPTSGQEKEVERKPSEKDITISSDVFKEYIEDTNSLFSPKNAAGKMSFRTDSLYANYAKDKTNVWYNFPELYRQPNQFSAVGDDEIYLVFFFTDSESNYFGKFQFHFTLTTTENWYNDRDEIEFYGHTLTCECWDMIDGSREQSTTQTLFENIPDSFFCLDFFDKNALRIRTTSSITNFVKYDFDNNYPKSFPNGLLAFNSDLSTSISLYNCYGHFTKTPDVHDETCKYGGGCDIGYIASVTPIETVYRIDTAKIPDNYYITVNGDTVYDYSITNPETGQTDTINNYITNNYTYVTNNNPVGGSSGGDVTVGGHIDVSGSVGVNVNVNVNGGGGGSYDPPNTDVFGSYYDQAIDESSDFRQFLSTFFSFLPVEIIGLLGIGLTFAILARILGR